MRHSQKGSVEKSSKVTLGARLTIRMHSYKSNCLVENCRYDVLLVMSWHFAQNLSINNEKWIVKVGENELATDSKDAIKANILNLSVKKFRNMMKGERSDVNVFRLVPKTKFEAKCGMPEEIPKYSNPGLRKMLKKYGSVFREELPSVLPPERAIDHEIEADKDAKPPHRPLYQLSPIELKAMKIYVLELLDNGKIRPSKSPYGALLFLVKEKDKPLPGVVDYRGLNRITKRNNALCLVQMRCSTCLEM